MTRITEKCNTKNLNFINEAPNIEVLFTRVKHISLVSSPNGQVESFSSSISFGFTLFIDNSFRD